MSLLVWLQFNRAWRFVPAWILAHTCPPLCRDQDKYTATLQGIEWRCIYLDGSSKECVYVRMSVHACVYRRVCVRALCDKGYREVHLISDLSVIFSVSNLPYWRMVVT